MDNNRLIKTDKEIKSLTQIMLEKRKFFDELETKNHVEKGNKKYLDDEKYFWDKKMVSIIKLKRLKDE